MNFSSMTCATIGFKAHLSKEKQEGLEYDFIPLPLLRWVWVTPELERCRGWCGKLGSEQHWESAAVDSAPLIENDASVECCYSDQKSL